MKTIIALSIALFSLSTFACENYAKYGAIKAYKAEMGTVQGSDGIEYEATLVGLRNDISAYVVSISDNNEDGEYWTVDYSVVLNKSCKILSVTKI